jgi:hypothetical protein
MFHPASAAMHTFRLQGLAPEMFAPLFDLDDAQLALHHARRVVATEANAFPCRVSLQDAEPGEELLLLPFAHQPADSPYRASGPVFVRRGAQARTLAAGEVPPYVTRRQISLRAYDDQHMMVAGEVVDGAAVAQRLGALFGDGRVAYVHLHNAKRGCYSCRAVRA